MGGVDMFWEVLLFLVLFIVAPLKVQKHFIGFCKLVPLVVMWMIAGIATGWVYPDLFQPETVKFFSRVGFFALQIFGLATGTHLEPEKILKEDRKILFLGFSSFIVSGVAGFLVFGLCIRAFPATFAGFDPLVIKTTAGIFSGITALPILSALLYSFGLTNTAFGKANIAMATLHDFFLWPLVGVINITANSHENARSGPLSLVFISIYLVVAFTLVPRSLKYLEQFKPKKEELKFLFSLVVVIALTIASSIASNFVGLHYLLGAVIAGALLTSDYKKTVQKVERPVLRYGLPFFIVSAGLGIRLGSLENVVYVFFGTLTICNLFSNGIGVTCVARAMGFSWRESLAFTSCLSCKGIVELAIAGDLYSSKAIPFEMYAAAVLMAITLTALTAPWLRLVFRGRWHMFMNKKEEEDIQEQIPELAIS